MSWYSVRPKILEELNNSIPRRIADLIKTKAGATNTDFIDCRHTDMLLCFLFGMYLSMLLRFHWIEFIIHMQMLSDYTLI